MHVFPVLVCEINASEQTWHLPAPADHSGEAKC